MSPFNREQAVRWQAPDLNPPPPATPLSMPTLAEIEAIEREASEEGFRRGHAEGYAAGQQAVEQERMALAARVDEIIAAMAKPLEKLDQDIGDALGQLAVQMAGALLRRAYISEPALLKDLVEQSLQMVMPAQRELELRLHPDDMQVLQELMDVGALPARLIPDASLERADVRVHAESVRIDASLNSRLAVLQAGLLASSPESST